MPRGMEAFRLPCTQVNTLLIHKCIHPQGEFQKLFVEWLKATASEAPELRPAETSSAVSAWFDKVDVCSLVFSRSDLYPRLDYPRLDSRQR
jgi:hypothetical protein